MLYPSHNQRRPRPSGKESIARRAIHLAILLIATLGSANIARSQAAITIPSDNMACIGPIIEAERYYRIPYRLLIAMGMVESADKIFPYPWTFNIGGNADYEPNHQSALQKLHRLQHSPASVDVGCLQINIHAHRRNFTTIDQMLDPAANAWYGAHYLASLHAETGDWTKAVARYHASDRSRAAQFAYVCAVWKTLVKINGAAARGGAAYCRK